MQVFQGAKKPAWPMPLPFIPGYDLSGVVESVDDAVSGFHVGDEVFAVNFADQSHGDGENTIASTFAEYIAIPASRLSHKPASVSHDVAASLALAGTTAFESLEVANVTSGTKMLILGGSSAVGTLAIQLAKLRGAWVVATVSSRSLEFAHQFGADKLINYTQTKWWLEGETGLAGFDLIFDAVGEAGAFEHAKTSGLLKYGGSFVTIASNEAGSDPTAHQPTFSYAARFTMSNSTNVQDKLIQLVSEGKLQVPIEQTFPFTEQGVRDIFTKISSGKSLGKNVLKIV